MARDFTLFHSTTLFRSHRGIAPQCVYAQPDAERTESQQCSRIWLLLRAMKETYAAPRLLPREMRTPMARPREYEDRKSTRLNSSHLVISYADFCLTTYT